MQMQILITNCQFSKINLTYAEFLTEETSIVKFPGQWISSFE
jgi:hypothetical protein